MEFIFEPTYGDLFSMEVPDGLTFVEIKDRIQALRRIHVSRQALFFEETPLNDGDVITLPLLSHIQLVVTLVLPLSPESIESPFLLGGPDEEIIRVYLRGPSLNIWASLEMDPKSDSVLGLKKKVEQLTEEIPTLGKKIRKLQKGFPDIKNKLKELRGNRVKTVIPWEMINLRIRNGSELGDSQILHDCGLADQSEVIISLHGLPDDHCTTSAAPPPPPLPPLAAAPTMHAAEALIDEELSVRVSLELCDRDELIVLVVKRTDKVGVIWYALRDREIDLQKNDHFYHLLGGTNLNRELTFGSYSMKQGDTIEIVPWETPTHQDLYERLLVGLIL